MLWETEYLTSGLLYKTIFVMPPAYRAIATLKTQGHLFHFPWFAVEANSDAPSYADRWAQAIEPLHRHGLAAPAYNWHGLLFAYGKDGIPFSCRIPVHTREFLAVYAALRERKNLA